MSYSCIIWTLQRTGGDTLLAILAKLSEHPAAPPEPFNRDGEFSDAAFGRDRQYSAEGVRRLEEICRKRVIIKHVYEWFSDEFNFTLARSADRYRYRHIHLIRRDEFERLASKGLAESLNVWRPNGAGHIFKRVKSGKAKLAPLDVDGLIASHDIAMLKAAAVNRVHRSRMKCLTVHFEDLYRGTLRERTHSLYIIASFLGIDPDRWNNAQSDVERLLQFGGQDTASVYPFLPGISDLRARLSQ